MIPDIRRVVQLTRGSVVLEAWGDHVADAYLLDLLTLTATLSEIREDWEAFQRQDVTASVWGAFWRLVQASLPDGMTLPRPLTWQDRLTLLEAMHDLNGLEEAEGKLKASARKAAVTLAAMRKRLSAPTTPGTKP